MGFEDKNETAALHALLTGEADWVIVTTGVLAKLDARLTWLALSDTEFRVGSALTITYAAGNAVCGGY